MPNNQVKNEHDEKAWQRAKARVRSEYPKIKEGSDRFYALVTTIYQNMRRPK